MKIALNGAKSRGVQTGQFRSAKDLFAQLRVNKVMIGVRLLCFM